MTPQIAAAVKTFGGTPLRRVLRDQLGVHVNKPIRARAHFYEAIPGTTRSLIAFHEKGVPGLGSARREAWTQIHPLTPEVAGLLVNEPGLGRPADPAFIANRNQVAVGQRLYYLEIPGARVRMAPRGPRMAAAPARSSQTRIVMDFPRRQLRIALYYSEAHAQELATLLRKKLPISAVLTAMKATHDASITQILSGSPTKAVRVIHEAAPVEQLAGPVIATALRAVGKQVAQLLIKWLLDVLKRELEARYDRLVAEFERATKAEADGVTLLIVFQAPPLLEQLRKFFAPGEAVLGIPGMVASLLRQTLSEYRFEIRPGFVQP